MLTPLSETLQRLRVLSNLEVRESDFTSRAAGAPNGVTLGSPE